MPVIEFSPLFSQNCFFLNVYFYFGIFYIFGNIIIVYEECERDKTV